MYKVIFVTTIVIITILASAGYSWTKKTSIDLDESKSSSVIESSANIKSQISNINKHTNAQNSPTDVAVGENFKPASLPRRTTQRSLDDFYLKTHNSHWVQEGKSDKVVYAYFDFGCPGCLIAYSEIKPLIDSNLISVRWIHTPISEVNNSKYKASFALKDRLQTMSMKQIIESDKSFSSSYDQGIALKLTDNKLSLLSYSNPRTPLFIYEKNGRPVVLTPDSVEAFKTQLGI